MKEKIYTIPVTEVFSEPCNCALCALERRFENECIDYTLGPSLMEPDSRIITNRDGFCPHHFEMLYNSKKNSVGLALILDTHLESVNAKLSKSMDRSRKAFEGEAKKPLFKSMANKLSSAISSTDSVIDSIVNDISALQRSCAICDKLNFTMERYIDVIFYLYDTEASFRRLFCAQTGFCLKHLKTLLASSKKYMTAKRRDDFVSDICTLQAKAMYDLKEDVSWFVKKFDYRFADEPWKNSKDSVSRAIAYLSGNVDLDT